MDIGKERIKRLFKLAKQRTEAGKKPLADRYVEIARKIGMRQNTPIPSELKKKFCSECKAYLVPGDNCKVRIKSKKKTVNYKCRECGNVDRHGFKD